MRFMICAGVSGASGTPLARNVPECLHSNRPEPETHLVVSRGGAITARCELAGGAEELNALADVVHPIDAIGSCIASGSFRTPGMIIVPCSMKTVAGIACGYADNLLLRAADVCIKERRPLVLCARESPLSAIHLRNMLELARAGAIIAPPMPGWYNHPANIDDMMRGITERLLAPFGLGSGAYEWEGSDP